ncbi:ankyrin repeat domain-containing protein [Utexia brackfieldae]|uniref:ankyrin repeat domain-containing protein n=1 Tax=Utexia brackfieldae TaxID=3074108 RepID=UPI00370DAC59
MKRIASLPLFAMSLLSITTLSAVNIAYADLSSSSAKQSTTMIITDAKTTITPQESKNMLTMFKQIKANNNMAVLDLIKNDASLLKARDAQGQTPLMAAIYQGNEELAKQLILAGADVNAQDNISNSPFLYAGAEGYYETLKLALSHGAQFDIYNRYGGTALIPAAEKGHVDNVMLLANTPHFPIDHVNNLGWTALMEAIVLGGDDAKHVQIIDILLKAGANPNIPDKKGVSALTHAKQKGFTEIVKLLQAYHAQ